MWLVTHWSNTVTTLNWIDFAQIITRSSVQITKLICTMTTWRFAYFNNSKKKKKRPSLAYNSFDLISWNMHAEQDSNCENNIECGLFTPEFNQPQWNDHLLITWRVTVITKSHHSDPQKLQKFKINSSQMSCHTVWSTTYLQMQAD